VLGLATNANQRLMNPTIPLPGAFTFGSFMKPSERKAQIDRNWPKV
jgi:hypothetical protein